jgi:hypothetical protein
MKISGIQLKKIVLLLHPISSRAIESFSLLKVTLPVVTPDSRLRLKDLKFDHMV